MKTDMKKGHRCHKKGRKPQTIESQIIDKNTFGVKSDFFFLGSQTLELNGEKTWKRSPFESWLQWSFEETTVFGTSKAESSVEIILFGQRKTKH